ncbi:AAA family ATPase [Xenorhabdus sp. PB62.4]|uniref:AAA family ATPase n=1 Tax=Xenorhabdus sp. PB62.4 TaxID=1851573 RepID=UPI001656CF9E|nr:ATP-binding protein [Xenorhabdus sp. PB62.4]MBC8953361.1 Vitamin B12 import ATP-binding protein BtuD [Xenorhabdus sp. PB62.4]
MSLRLKKLKIERLFGQKNIELDFKEVNVLVGKNGLGKTTVLKILNALLTGDINCHELTLCEKAALTFNTGEIISFINNDEVAISKYLDKLLEDFDIKGEISHLNIISEVVNKINKKKGAIHHDIITYSNDSLMEKLSKEVNVCYISTLNMSANAHQEITKSDGRTKNILDWELDDDLKKLMQIKDSSQAKKFETVMTLLLTDSGKYVKIINNESVNFYDNKSNRLIALENLSSGERQIIYILTKIANTQGKPTFLLMDEPEISLHLNWQEKLIDNILEINNQCQIMVVTHSPAIIMDGYMDSYVDIKQITTEMLSG